jgi:oligopeptide/dipeptide ABC transporter ATP-binding protein
VTIQAQILKLMRNLIAERGTSVLFTTHDLGAAWEICDRVTVMYAGTGGETAEVGAFFDRPAHPYTRNAAREPADAALGAARHSGRRPQSVRAADRLPLPSALPARRGGLQATHPLPSRRRRATRCAAIIRIWRTPDERAPARTGRASRGASRSATPGGCRIGWLRALDGVSLQIGRGEILGVVGESGCGKSTLGKTITGIHAPSAGSIRFEGNEIAGLTPRAGAGAAQPVAVLLPGPGRFARPALENRARARGAAGGAHQAVARRAQAPGARDARGGRASRSAHLDLYPHEISGGQQRRVGLARVMMLRPSLIILDEPTSGLDVSVQATVLNLFAALSKAHDLAYMFISHDLSVVRLFSHRIAVMYLGRIVETGETSQIFANPKHPYTQSLLAAVPQIGGRRVTDTFWLEGEPPSPDNLPPGCRFAPRCPRADGLCGRDDPASRALADGRLIACHHAVDG